MEILIVDDEQIIRKGVMALLERSEMPISLLHEARNGKDAIKLLRDGNIDIVITDIKMPIMDGIELCKLIHNEYSEVEVIILSGYEEFSYAKKALQYGVIDYLLKPVTNENLHDTLLRLLTESNFKWGNSISEELIIAIRSNVSELLKAIVSEDTDKVNVVLEKWKEYCLEHGYSILKMREIMSAYLFIYKSSIVKHIKSEIANSELKRSNHHSVDSLFEDYINYFKAEIKSIQISRVPRSSLIIQDVLKVIHEDYKDPELNIKILADSVGISTSYLSKLFRETMNIPITRYISEHRLAKSREMIRNKPNLSITDICYASGFNDYPYYSKYFKRFYGVSPQDYRNLN